MKLLMLVGPPGSGKSTLAKKMFLDNSQFRYVNQDSQGKEGHLTEFTNALLDKADILIDRMNFSKEQREKYLGPAREANYETEIHVLHVPFRICMQRCLERVGHETITTQEDASRAINFFFTKYERVTDDEANTVVRIYDHPEGERKEHAVVFDLDGTLCNIDQRLHYVKTEGKKDWKMFFRGIKEDSLNEWCYDLIQKFEPTHQVVLASGRPDDHRRSTLEWLSDKGVPFDNLFMRKRGDFRQDNIVKEIILEFDIKPQYEVLFVVDDRKQVVDMWRSHDVVCLACAEGDF